MHRALILLALVCGPGWTAETDRYLKAVRAFVDTMMARGVDHYGPVHSPLFAAMLDLKTLSLPSETLPDEFYKENGMHQAVGYGLPDPPVGIRPGDRSPLGNNLEHDIMLLRTMYELTAVTGEKKYAAHAEAVLRFWLLNCQSPVTGLMASGEHMSWEFARERAYGNVHEVFRRFPFWDKLYSVDPWRALRIADGLWLAQIGDKKVGDFSRHAGYRDYRPGAGAAYPRHAGFYIWAYANAYAQSRDPKYIERVELLLESRTRIRPQPFSLLIEPGSFQPEQSTDPALRLLLWDAAGQVPSRRQAWRAIVRQLDEKAFARPATERLSSSSTPRPVTPAEEKKRVEPLARLETAGRVLTTQGGTRTKSTTLSPLWNMGYGSSGASGRALLDLTRYLQTGDARFLQAATGVADRLVAEGIPATRNDLWPRACGQVISLLVALAREKGVPPEKQRRYMDFAGQVADMSLGLFTRNSLFRADGMAEHYEAITGADDLLWGLLQLHCARLGTPHQLGHNDVNW